MKATLISLVLLFSSLTVFAQEKPAAELFGGYSYIPISPGFSLKRVNTNGVAANLTINGSFMDFSADFGWHAGNLAGNDLTVFTVMAGPRFARHGKKITWFVHNLYGVARIKVDGNVAGAAGINGQPDTSFAMVVGGGVDVKLNDRIAVRVFQLDSWSATWETANSSLHPRLSTGIVIRLGKR